MILNYVYTYRKHMSNSLHPRDLGVIVRNTQPEDITRIVDLQKESFPYLSRYGNIWHPEELESHLRIFPQGQFVAVEPDGMVVGSASTLIVLLEPEYAKHTHEGIGGMLYEARKELVAKLNLRRMIAGGRLFNYTEYADRMSPDEYADKVMKGELKDPVLSFELDNGFRFVKILPNYLDDVRSLNYASF